MTTDTEPVVVVGASVAGGQAVHTLRGEGFDGRIVLVGEEPDRPYERPPLSKELLLGRMERDWVFMKPADWYQDNEVELRFGVRAVALDPADSAVQLDDGRRLGFSACVLATGGRPRRLPVAGAGLGGVRYLRNLEESAALKADLDRGARVVVVGAGFIGAEVASAARQLGCEVTMLEIAPLPLGRVLAPDLGEMYRDLHAGHGVDVRLNEGVDMIQGAARVEAVVGTSGHVYAADTVVVGVGIEPSVEIARDAGLRCDNGIVVDELCRTSAPNVYAVGDVACHPNPWAGGLVRVEHLQHAQRHGAAAARSILGRGQPYGELHWFWTDQYDVNLQILGHPSPGDDTVTRGRLDAHDCIRFFMRGDKAVAAIGINRGKDMSAARRLIERRVPVDGTRLADDGVALRDLLKPAG